MLGNTLRVQIELNENHVARLEELMRQAGIRTRRELFDHALTLLLWAAQERKIGRKIGSIQPDGNYTELFMPVLESMFSPVKELIEDPKKASK